MTRHRPTRSANLINQSSTRWNTSQSSPISQPPFPPIGMTLNGPTTPSLLTTCSRSATWALDRTPCSATSWWTGSEKNFERRSTASYLAPGHGRCSSTRWAATVKSWRTSTCSRESLRSIITTSTSKRLEKKSKSPYPNWKNTFPLRSWLSSCTR